MLPETTRNLFLAAMRKTTLLFLCGVALFAAGCSGNNDSAMYSVTVTSGNNGTASANAAKVAVGATVTLTATPDEGYLFLGWAVESGGVSFESAGAATTTFTMPARNVSVKAAFIAKAPTTYKITVTNNGNGTAAADKPVATEGTTVNLTATADRGYFFSEWTVEEGQATFANASAARTSFVMTAGEVIIKAIFAEQPPCAITVTNDGNGIGQANMTEALVDETVRLLAIPNSGYAFSRWVVLEGNVTLGSTTEAMTTFIMPDTEVRIRAEFVARVVEPIEINGVKWAPFNLSTPRSFTYNPQDTGMLYQWNRFRALPGAGFEVPDWNGTNEPGDSWAAENDPCPAGWHVPTLDELNTLLVAANVTYAREAISGTEGTRFTDRSSGRSIFLPITGFRSSAGTAIGGVAQQRSYYWSSTMLTATTGYSLYFEGTRAPAIMGHTRSMGNPVRCVKD